jgi:hypothetical protein
MLSDERPAFWAEIYGVEPTVAQVLKIYGRYENETRAGARKAPARCVIWAGAEDEISHAEVKRQGRLLIGVYQPSANTVKGAGKDRPDDVTRAIAAAMDGEIPRIDPHG